MNGYPNSSKKQRLVMHGARWIAEWLSERQIAELDHFFNRDLSWKEFDEREQVREKIREVKTAFEEALQLADDDPEQFLLEWKKAKGTVIINGTVPPESEFDTRVYNCVADTALHGEWYAGWPFEGKPHIFRRVQGRGNSEFERADVSPQEAVKAVEALLDEKGAAAFPARGNGYPTKLLREAGEQLGVSRRTMGRLLKRAKKTPNVEATHIRVKKTD